LDDLASKERSVVPELKVVIAAVYQPLIGIVEYDLNTLVSRTQRGFSAAEDRFARRRSQEVHAASVLDFDMLSPPAWGLRRRREQHHRFVRRRELHRRFEQGHLEVIGWNIAIGDDSSRISCEPWVVRHRGVRSAITTKASMERANPSSADSQVSHAGTNGLTSAGAILRPIHHPIARF
jgi:hypothetical protein